MNDETMEENVGDGQVPPMENAMVCMAVVENGSRIAFAAYNEEMNEIMVEDNYLKDFETQGIVERVLNCVRPTLLLLSNRIVGNEGLLDVLTTPPPSPDHVDTAGEQVPLCENDSMSAHRPSGSIPYRLMKSASFEIRGSKSRLLRLKVKSLLRSQERGALHGSDRRFPLSSDAPSFGLSSYHGIASIVDFDSSVLVQALGGLLSFLECTVFSLEPGNVISVNDIRPLSATAHMLLSQDTLSALNIFATERHPLAAASGRGNSKEGMSLFALLDRTKSQSGRQRLREWMMKPLVDVRQIAARQNGVELFMESEMSAVSATLLDLLGQVGPVDKILARMQKCCTRPNDFVILVKTISAALSVLATLQRDVLWVLQQQVQTSVDSSEGMDVDNPAAPYLSFVESILSDCCYSSLEDLLSIIGTIVDENATATNQTVVVRRGYNETLDNMKDQYDQIGETLRQVADGLTQRWPNFGTVLSTIFMPQVGFLIALKQQNSWARSNAVPEDFTFVFGKDGTSFYKNPDMQLLDETYGDIDSYIKDTEALIVSELEDIIIDQDYELRVTFSALAELDCILSFSSFSSDNGYVRPEVVSSEESCIVVKNGRHPLQELLIEGDFVPNDVNMDTASRVNIITGPNFSGKSCYARQVGILTYMTQIGCFLPCEYARISIVEQIMARFSSAESCAVPQSSFQLDLTKMAGIIRRAGLKSLVIIDEFGKGTSPSSGVALLTSALQTLAQKGCMVVCTTHFLEVFSMGLLNDGEDGIRALQMSIRVPEKKDEQALPLFKLERGVANSSAGLVCAKMAGVKQAVIERAYEIVAATKERNRVEPLMEIWRRNLTLSEEGKQTLLDFLGTDWNEASEDEIEGLIQAVKST